MNLFELLKKKLGVKRSKDFDQRFWAKFEKEFSSQRIPKKRLFDLAWPQLVPAGALGLAVLIGGGLYFTSKNRLNPERIEVAELMMQEEFLENVDLFVELEGAELSDEDWDLLLADGGEVLSEILLEDEVSNEDS